MRPNARPSAEIDATVGQREVGNIGTDAPFRLLSGREHGFGTVDRQYPRLGEPGFQARRGAPGTGAEIDDPGRLADDFRQSVEQAFADFTVQEVIGIKTCVDFEFSC